MNEWQTLDHALTYLERADRIPHRPAGEAALVEELPPNMRRVLDLGSGAGRLLDLVLRARPGARGVALDFSPPMLERLKERFAQDAGEDAGEGAHEDARIEIVEHDLDDPLPDLGSFDAVVSSFVIHHLEHPRKRQLYREIWSALEPGGVFCNLEHVASPTTRLHLRFLDAIGLTPEQEDSANKLLDLETQLGWLREIGFEDVDCHWKWRELALLVGNKGVLSR